ncbi:probable N-acetyltransferase 14 [Lepisosteus oculatus]|uniref:probable N-acetyltransferase 14 n=1 Tax=Lepisosteus oculatus TaxID=7918 RepID=UPI00371FC98B
MTRIDLSKVVIRRMKEEDIDFVKELIKEGSKGSENRLILYLLTRPLALLLLAVLSSALRFLLHSFVAALVLPVFLVVLYLKVTLTRSVGILGSRQPYWDYLGSCPQPGQECTLENPHARADGQGALRRRRGARDRAEERDSLEVWLADWEGEIVGCVARDRGSADGEARLCRLAVSSWYRREGIGRLLAGAVERRARRLGLDRVCAPVPAGSKAGGAFFRSLGYRREGEGAEPSEGEELSEGEEGEDGEGAGLGGEGAGSSKGEGLRKKGGVGERGREGRWLGYRVTDVFVKEL